MFLNSQVFFGMPKTNGVSVRCHKNRSVIIWHLTKILFIYLNDFRKITIVQFKRKLRLWNLHPKNVWNFPYIFRFYPTINMGHCIPKKNLDSTILWHYSPISRSNFSRVLAISLSTNLYLIVDLLNISPVSYF